MKNRYACIIGKWQYLHWWHRYLLDRAIQEYGIENILIIVWSAQLDNPHTAKQRMKTIWKEYPWITEIHDIYDTETDGEWIDDILISLDCFLLDRDKWSFDIIAWEEYPWQKLIGNPVIWKREEGPFPWVSSTKIRESLLNEKLSSKN